MPSHHHHIGTHKFIQQKSKINNKRKRRRKKEAIENGNKIHTRLELMECEKIEINSIPENNKSSNLNILCTIRILNFYNKIKYLIEEKHVRELPLFICNDKGVTIHGTIDETCLLVDDENNSKITGMLISETKTHVIGNDNYNTTHIAKNQVKIYAAMWEMLITKHCINNNTCIHYLKELLNVPNCVLNEKCDSYIMKLCNNSEKITIYNMIQKITDVLMIIKQSYDNSNGKQFIFCEILHMNQIETLSAMEHEHKTLVKIIPQMYNIYSTKTYINSKENQNHENATKNTRLQNLIKKKAIERKQNAKINTLRDKANNSSKKPSISSQSLSSHMTKSTSTVKKKYHKSKLNSSICDLLLFIINVSHFIFEIMLNLSCIDPNSLFINKGTTPDKLLCKCYDHLDIIMNYMCNLEMIADENNDHVSYESNLMLSARISLQRCKIILERYIDALLFLSTSSSSSSQFSFSSSVREQFLTKLLIPNNELYHDKSTGLNHVADVFLHISLTSLKHHWARTVPFYHKNKRPNLYEIYKTKRVIPSQGEQKYIPSDIGIDALVKYMTELSSYPVIPPNMSSQLYTTLETNNDLSKKLQFDEVGVNNNNNKNKSDYNERVCISCRCKFIMSGTLDSLEQRQLDRCECLLHIPDGSEQLNYYSTVRHMKASSLVRVLMLNKILLYKLQRGDVDCPCHDEIYRTKLSKFKGLLIDSI